MSTMGFYFLRQGPHIAQPDLELTEDDLNF